MGFTIPDYPDVADGVHDDQAFPNSTDIAMLTAGLAGDGIQSGCQVTAQGAPNMTVHVAAGTRLAAWEAISVSASNPIITASGANPRRDLVYVSDVGVAGVVAGTPVAVDPDDPNVVPVLPAVPAGAVGIAAVDVPASASAITSDEIVDKRVILTGAPSTTRMELLVRKSADESISNNTIQADDHLLMSVGANEVWELEWRLIWSAENAGDIKVGWTFPTGGHLIATWIWTNTASELGTVFPLDTTTSPAGPTPFQSAIVGGYRQITPIHMVYINGANAGTLQFQWAQNTTYGTPTIMRANSTLWGAQLA